MAFKFKNTNEAEDLGALAAAASANAIKAIQNANNKPQASTTGVTTYTPQQEQIKSQMAENSIKWYSAPSGDANTPGTKEWLAAQNQKLGANLGGSVTFDSATGTWSGNAATPIIPTVTPTYDYSTPAPTAPAQDARIDALLNEILNREDFSYNAANDPLYQQYQAMYQREGDRSMNDTLAAAASNAGGMNSYAITAAQQAGDYYASQLGDKIPELYQLAYSMYLDDKASKVEDLGLLRDMDNTQYSRYRDTMADWRNDRDFAYGQYRDDVADYQWGTNFNYAADRDKINDQRYDQEWAYGVGRDEIADSRYDQEWEYGVGRDEIADQRYENEWNYNVGRDQVSDSQWQQEFEYKKQQAASGGGSGSGSGSGSGGATITKSDAWKMYDAGISTPAALEAYVKYGLMTQEQANELGVGPAPGPTGGTVLGDKAKSIRSSLEMMTGQMGADKAIANSILVYISDGEITPDEGAALLEHFGYNPDEYLE